MKSLIDKNKSIGLPMMHYILSREKLVVNHKRTERIYKEQVYVFSHFWTPDPDLSLRFAPGPGGCFVG